jgi:proteasome lid subunit RPN8/RPN11
MRRHVESEVPLEACGIVAGKEGFSEQIFEISNELQSPVLFRMHPKQQLTAMLEIEEKSLQMLAIYHSHPAGPPRPSTTDIQEATFPEVLQLIWSSLNGDWHANAFNISSNSVHQVEVNVLPPQ